MKNLTLVAVLLAIVCGLVYAQDPKPAPAPNIPLLGNLLAPNAEWLDCHRERPVGEVTMIYNIHELLRAYARQTQRLNALEQRLAVLEARLAPPEPKPVDPNSPSDK